MSRRRPELPPAIPPPTAASAPSMQGAGANAAASGLSSAFSRFRFAPALAGMQPQTAGRRSLLGG